MKTLNKVLSEIYGDRPVKGGEAKFVKKHQKSDPKLAADRNGNKGGLPFKAKTKAIERSPKHGYDTGQDKSVYEDHDPVNRADYLKHHDRAVQALVELLDHLKKHKKFLEKHSEDDDSMVRHPNYDMKSLARQLEDVSSNAQDTLRTSDQSKLNTPVSATASPKKYISGSKYG